MVKGVSWKRIVSIVLLAIIMTQNLSALFPGAVVSASTVDSTPDVYSGVRLQYEEEVRITWDRWYWENQKVGDVSRSITVVEVQDDNFTVREDVTYTMYLKTDSWWVEKAYVDIRYMNEEKWEPIAEGSPETLGSSYDASMHVHYVVNKTDGVVLKVWEDNPDTDTNDTIPLKLQLYWSYIPGNSPYPNPQEYAWDVVGFSKKGENWGYSVEPYMDEGDVFDGWTVKNVDVVCELSSDCMNLSKAWTDVGMESDWESHKFCEEDTGIKLEQLWFGDCKYLYYDDLNGWDLFDGFTVYAEQKLSEKDITPPTVSFLYLPDMEEKKKECGADDFIISNSSYQYAEYHHLWRGWLGFGSYMARGGWPSPTATSSHWYTFPLEVIARDDSGISKVEFYVDDELRHTDYEGSALYKGDYYEPWVWDMSEESFLEGAHEFKASAYDRSKYHNCKNVTWTLFVDYTPPSGSFTAPSKDGTCFGTEVIRVEADDNYGVRSVSIYVDYHNKLVGNMHYDAEQGWMCFWNTTALIDGEHKLHAKITDYAGFQTWIYDYNVTVDNSDRPAVKIKSPSPDSFVHGTVTVNVEAPETVSKINYSLYYYPENPSQAVGWVSQHLDDSPEVGTSGLYSWNWDTTKDPDYEYMIQVRAYTSEETYSEDTVWIVVDNTSPTISITEPGEDDTIHDLTLVSAEASDARARPEHANSVQSVDFSLVDEDEFEWWHAVDTTEADGWAVLLDTALVDDGKYTLKAEAADKAGLTSSSTISVHTKQPIISIEDVTVSDGAILRAIDENKVTVTVTLNNSGPVDGEAIVQLEGLVEVGIRPRETKTLVTVPKAESSGPGQCTATLVFSLSDFDWLNGWTILLTEKQYYHFDGTYPKSGWQNFVVNVTNVFGTRAYDQWPRPDSSDLLYFEWIDGGEFGGTVEDLTYPLYVDDTVKQNQYIDVGERFLLEIGIQPLSENVSYISIDSDTPTLDPIVSGFTREHALVRANTTGLKKGDVWYTSHMEGYEHGDKSYVAETYEWTATTAGAARLNFHIKYNDTNGVQHETVLVKPIIFYIYENDKTVTEPQVISDEEMSVTVFGVKGKDVSIEIRNKGKVYYSYKIDGNPADFWGQAFSFVAPGGVVQETISVDLVDDVRRFEVQYEKSVVLNLLDGVFIAVSPLLPSPFDDVPTLIELLLLVAQEKPPETLESNVDFALYILNKIVKDEDFQSKVSSWAVKKFKVDFLLGQLLEDTLAGVSAIYALYKIGWWTWHFLESRGGTVPVTVVDPPEEYVVAGETMPSLPFFGGSNNETAIMGTGDINMSINEGGEGEYHATYEINPAYTSLTNADFDVVSRLTVYKVGKRNSSSMKGNVTVHVFPTQDSAISLSKALLADTSFAESFVESYFINMESFESRLAGDHIELRGTGELHSSVYDNEVNTSITITKEKVYVNFFQRGKYAEVADGGIETFISFGPRFNIPLNNTRLSIDVPYDFVSASPEPDYTNHNLHWNLTPPHVIIYSSESPPPIVRLHEIVWETETYNVRTMTNSTLQNFAFNQPLKQISFYLAGTSGTESFCNVTIPKSLLQGSLWAITMDDVAITDFTTTENITHTSLYFTYTHGSIHYVRVQGTWVIPEFPLILILLMFTILTMLSVFFVKRKNPRKLNN